MGFAFRTDRGRRAAVSGRGGIGRGGIGRGRVGRGVVALGSLVAAGGAVHAVVNAALLRRPHPSAPPPGP
ncbi:MAG TPA: hypothetical protein VEL73_07730, partial [Mycobacteriales bacterium]|nr:hypothetical protein [Mycobacteriales bacterium]